MLEIVGKYQHVVTHKPEVFIKLVGEKVTPERLEALSNGESFLTVKYDDDCWTFTATVGMFWQRSIRFTLGKTFIEGNRRAKTTATRDGNIFTFSSTVGSKGFQRIYEFSEAGVIVTLIDFSGEKAERIFRRFEC
ncbi:putative lipid binding protein [Trypoxylus dichotomus]